MSAFHLLAEPIQEMLKESGFSDPTEPQERGIPLILEGKNLLLIAPTGTGKTEAAFLPVLHFLLRDREEGIRAIYITPLRALNRDILERFEKWCKRFDIRLGVRHGDTDARERSVQALVPPEILITTPETLQAILTGKTMRKHLSSVKWVIVDEVHELASEKRGTQLSLALERLRLISGDFQTIGLSATIGSPEKIAKFLVGPERSCEIVQVPVTRKMELKILLPKPSEEDYRLSSELGTFPEVAARLRCMREIVDRHESVLLFTNTRSIAEVLASRFRVWDIDIPIGIHHGSLSRTSRMDTEKALKEGEMQGIVCTSSLELGIDIGRLDAVIQYNSPRQVTRLLQRVGRSGHRIGETAKGYIITQDSDDAFEAMVIGRRALIEEMEEVKIPELCYDVLMHQIVGLLMTGRGKNIDEILEIVRKSYPYSNLEKEELQKVMEYMHEYGLAWLSEDEILFRTKRKGFYSYYFENLSMIPDEKQWLVLEEDNPVGVLDESFVSEHGEIGKKFIMRGSPWRIKHVYKNFIYVDSEEDPTGSVPSWIGEEIPVPFEIAQEVGNIRGFIERKLNEGLSPREIAEILARKYPIDVETLFLAMEEILEQKERDLPLPTDRRITIEKWEDYIIIHCSFGLLINRTISRILGHILAERTGQSVGVQQDPYRILLKTDLIDEEEVKEILLSLKEKEIRKIAEESISNTGLYKRRIIHVAKKCGALSKEYDFTKLDVNSFHGVIKEEAMRTALLKDFDVEGAERVLKKISSMEIVVLERGEISPMARIGMEELQRYSDLIPPRRMHKLIIRSVRARLLNESLTFACMVCGRMETVRVAHAKLRCDDCESQKIGVTKKTEEEIRKNKRTWDEIRKSSDLIRKYGHPAVIVLAGRVGLKEAESILRRCNEECDELIELIIEAEKESLRRRFWKRI
ncbi:MAG: DEAD/DEAH box helicase [Candidatus Syntropharchaeia archaeon]